jgi:hypothetical protein
MARRTALFNEARKAKETISLNTELQVIGDSRLQARNTVGVKYIVVTHSCIKVESVSD